MGFLSAFPLFSGEAPPALRYIHPCHSAGSSVPSLPLPVLPYFLRCAPLPIPGSLPSSFQRLSALRPSISGSHLPLPVFWCPAAAPPSAPSSRWPLSNPHKRLYIQESRWRTIWPGGSWSSWAPPASGSAGLTGSWSLHRYRLVCKGTRTVPRWQAQQSSWGLCGHFCWGCCHPVLLIFSRGGDSHAQVSSRCPAGISPGQTSNALSAPCPVSQQFYRVSPLYPPSMLWMPGTLPLYYWIPVAFWYIRSFASRMPWHSGFHFPHRFQQSKFFQLWMQFLRFVCYNSF